MYHIIGKVLLILSRSLRPTNNTVYYLFRIKF